MSSASALPGVEALTFDVFGTVVDWHASVTRAVKDRAASTSNIAAFPDDGMIWTRTSTTCSVLFIH